MRTVLFAAVVALLLVCLATSLFAHGGGLDSQGGHRDRKTGTYHFHRGPLAGQSFPSKSAATAALKAHYEKSERSVAGSSTDPKAVIKKASTSKKVDALIALLVKKGRITEAELAEGIKGHR